MKAKYADVREWLDECRSIVRQDLDNVILFTGDEGSGKSTLMFQIMKALDDAFTVDRCHFSIDDFLDAVGDVPPYGSIAMDEAELNARRGMYTGTLDLLDHLQVARGLNQHVAICFPHEGLFEKAIAKYRIRFKVHVPRRGFFVLYKRTKREWRNRKGEVETAALWSFLGSWTFAANDTAHPEWARYKEKKGMVMRNRTKARKAESSPAGRYAIDDGLGAAYLRDLRRTYDDRAGSRADVRSQVP